MYLNMKISKASRYELPSLLSFFLNFSFFSVQNVVTSLDTFKGRKKLCLTNSAGSNYKLLIVKGNFSMEETKFLCRHENLNGFFAMGKGGIFHQSYWFPSEFL